MMAKKERKGRAPKKPPTPPALKPWDIPLAPTEGDADKNVTFAAVGSALSAWEKLEESVTKIFSDLVSPDQTSLAAERAYGSVLSFRGRADLVDAAADAAFFLSPNDPLKAALDDLVKEIRNFASRRNEIAHGKVTDYYRPSGLLLLVTGHRTRRAGYVLEPTSYATNKRELHPGRILLETAYQKPRYAYSSTEILTFQTHFERLAEQARLISIKVWRHQLAQRPS